MYTVGWAVCKIFMLLQWNCHTFYNSGASSRSHSKAIMHRNQQSRLWWKPPTFQTCADPHLRPGFGRALHFFSLIWTDRSVSPLPFARFKLHCPPEAGILETTRGQTRRSALLFLLPRAALDSAAYWDEERWFLFSMHRIQLMHSRSCLAEFLNETRFYILKLKWLLWCSWKGSNYLVSWWPSENKDRLQLIIFCH